MLTAQQRNWCRPAFLIAGLSLLGCGPNPDGSDSEPGRPGTDEPECADFRPHGLKQAGDTTPFGVAPGNFYQCFYFKSPWKQNVQGTSVEPLSTDSGVAHHMLLYSVPDALDDGGFDACTGVHDGGTIIPALGIDKLPRDVGFEIEAGPERRFLLEVHYINLGTNAVPDRTGLRLCTSRTPRPRTASLALLGSEAITLPPQSRGTAQGFCFPGREGAETSEIEVYVIAPHMHLRGASAEVLVHRANGRVDPVFDQPYDYANPLDHPVSFRIGPNDFLETRCNYANPTTDWVPFGADPFTSEMCYLFTLAHPPRALWNAAGWSFSGASNACMF
jgi:hypothetical protein